MWYFQVTMTRSENSAMLKFGRRGADRLKLWKCFLFKLIDRELREWHKISKYQPCRLIGSEKVEIFLLLDFEEKGVPPMLPLKNKVTSGNLTWTCCEGIECTFGGFQFFSLITSFHILEKCISVVFSYFPSLAKHNISLQIEPSFRCAFKECWLFIPIAPPHNLKTIAFYWF